MADSTWQDLESHRDQHAHESISDLFLSDPGRAQRYRTQLGPLLLDYSKNRVNDTTLDLLGRLASASRIAEARDAMYRGEPINNTEQRPALHTLLRTPGDQVPPQVSGESNEVQKARAQIRRIAQQINHRSWLGATDQPVTDVVHIGIGGSYLGPRMIDEALSFRRESPIRVHYVANVDGHHLDDALASLSPSTTLIIVVSKSFSTMETRLNAESARRWLLTKIPQEQLNKHQIAITSNVDAAEQFGISADNILPIWDWVGGRYSLWSAVGLAIAISNGPDAFDDLLSGAHQMDQHFASAAWPHNIPMMLAMLGVWYHNFLDADTCAVLSYDHRLRLLPAHLQQLDMESNGKRVTRDGSPVSASTGPIIWGGEGTNGQHAFHQLIHQGTRLIPVDFILPLKPDHSLPEHHHQLVASCLSQSQALMQGQPAEQIEADERVIAHKVMPGNRPSNTIMIDSLTPKTLGMLVALYEHKVFCQAMVWGINPFDQWGVELCKAIGTEIYSHLVDDTPLNSADPSTRSLIEHFRNVHNGQ